MHGGSSGPSTDRHNDPTFDPSRNVLDLVETAIKRQDDLRHGESMAIRAQVISLTELMGARFSSIDREFALIESRRIEQKVDTKVAVDAALSAAEKAVKEQTVASEKSILKSETSAAEQSKQQNATFTAALKGVTDVVADVKDRLVKIESRKEGSSELSKSMVAILYVVLSAVAIFVTIAVATHGFTK